MLYSWISKQQWNDLTVRMLMYDHWLRTKCYDTFYKYKTFIWVAWTGESGLWGGWLMEGVRGERGRPRQRWQQNLSTLAHFLKGHQFKRKIVNRGEKASTVKRKMKKCTEAKNLLSLMHSNNAATTPASSSAQWRYKRIFHIWTNIHCATLTSYSNYCWYHYDNY